MTRRQSNNQWSGGIAAHPAPKNSEYENTLEEFSPRFVRGDQDGILLIGYLPKGQTINAVYYSYLLLQLKDILKQKHRMKVSKGVLFFHNNALLTGHLQPRRARPTWASSVLITHPILRILPRRSATCSLD